MNPNPTTFDYLNPGVPNATYTNLAPAFDRLAIYTRNPGSFDELKVLTVPEPSSTTLVLAAGIAFCIRRRRV